MSPPPAKCAFQQSDGDASPAGPIVDGVLVAAAGESAFGFDAVDGALLWRQEFGLPVATANADASNVYLVATAKAANTLITIDLHSGKERWRFDELDGVDLIMFAVPAARDGVVILDVWGYFGSATVAFDAITGKALWMVEGREVIQDSSESGAAALMSSQIVDGRLLMTGDRVDFAKDQQIGQVAAVDVQTGSALWHTELDGPYGFYPTILGNVGIVTVETAASDVFDEIHAYDMDSGHFIGRARFPAEITGVSAYDDRLAVMTTDGLVSSVSTVPAVGWTSDQDFGRAPDDLAAGGATVAAKWDDLLVVLDGATGEQLWRASVAGLCELGPVSDELAVVVTDAPAGITALDPLSGEEIWTAEFGSLPKLPPATVTARGIV
jgi:outer membrane protein assembly factor BamB